MTWLKRVFIGFAGVAIVGLAAFSVLAWQPAIAPITPPPPASFPAELIAHGKACADCGRRMRKCRDQQAQTPSARTRVESLGRPVASRPP